MSKQYINKSYKPHELEEIIKLLQDTDFESKTSEQVLIDWHKMGYRIVKTGVQG